MTHIRKRNTHNKTKKNRKINGKMIEEKQGWKVLEIWGSPFERGYAHGFLLADELTKVKKVLPFVVGEQLHISFAEYMEKCNSLVLPIIKKKYPEFYAEIRGISAGSLQQGVYISPEFIVAWNAFLSLYSYYEDGKQPLRCSAFIAVGNATERGDIVMAHNTHSDFATGQLLNIVMTITPQKGQKFRMQTSAGFISSTSDWFLCENGIIGCETTIADMKYRPRFGTPYFCRIRQAIQYGKTLDDYVEIMKRENAGDYSCSWLLGNINTNEIMLFELGLKHENIQKTQNGVFYGMNSAQGAEFRKEETTDKEHDDEKTSLGSRNHRLDYLLNEKYYGKININNSKKIMGDHYDMFLDKTVRNRRGICKHNECDKDAGYSLYGCTDSKITNTNMAKELGFTGRFGSACGRVFRIKTYVREHPENKQWGEFVGDFPKTKWVSL